MQRTRRGCTDEQPAAEEPVAEEPVAEEPAVEETEVIAEPEIEDETFVEEPVVEEAPAPETENAFIDNAFVSHEDDNNNLTDSNIDYLTTEEEKAADVEVDENAELKKDIKSVLLYPYNASGIMHFINQLGINKAREMFFTANPITAEDALNVGLVNHIAPEADLPALLEEKFCAPLRRNSIRSVSAIKRQFRILSRAASTMSSESFERINAYRTKVYRGEDYKEGIRSFIEKREPHYQGKASDLDE